MKIKAVSLLIVLAMVLTLLAGCNGAKPAETSAATTAATTTAAVDAVTTASIVKDADAFLKAISKDGTWIIATLNDLTIDKELVLDGTFKNGKKDDAGKDIIQRKIALYTQDADHKVTARFNLTAPKLTVKSENARIQGGTFKGDVYVEANNFMIVDAKVEGNVYFASEEFKSSFKLDKGGTVTGATEVKK
ncbi:MAG: hypothetical protein FIA99_05180 [Ruminiclostridium sp.]|nr:hypothetical protein [Ruminiclostridium sp.]